jgi:NADH:ubiquinone oxidoreductase subunit E
MADSAVRIIPPDEAHGVIDRYRDVDPMEAMIPILQELQTRYGFITEAVVNQMAEELGISVTEIYGVVTFYSFFRFSPAGGRTLLTCEGTSCYVRGAAKLRERMEDRLHIVAEQTTSDGRLTFVPMAVCVGACDLGPVVEVEGQYYDHVTPEKLDAIIDEWQAKPLGEVAHGHGAAADMGPYGFGPTAEELGSALPNAAPQPVTPARTGLRTKGTR